MKIFLFGASGKMGCAVIGCARDSGKFEVTGGFDIKPANGLPTFDDVKKVNVPFDAIIDFSRPETLDSVIELAKSRNCPVVLCTTGYDDNEAAKINELSKSVPVFKSGNMSVGMNVLISLAEQATKLLWNDSDVEIIEAHHNRKVDAPSGTAKMIADAVNKASGEKAEFVYGREGNDCKRKKGDVGIHAIRGGTIVGEHEVMFCMNDEVVTIKHSALSRNIFADGALKAAEFLQGKSPAIYDMKDMLK